MQKKSFKVRLSFKRKHSSLKNSLQSTARPKPFLFNLAKTPEEGQLILRSITEAWSMVSAVGMELTETSVIKYLRKRLEEKSFHYTLIILEILRTRELPRIDKRIEDFSESAFNF